MAYGRKGKKKTFKRRRGKRVGNRYRKPSSARIRRTIQKAMMKGRPFRYSDKDSVVTTNYLATDYGHGRDVVFGTSLHGCPCFVNTAITTMPKATVFHHTTRVKSDQADMTGKEHPFNDTEEGETILNPRARAIMKNCYENVKLTNFGHGCVYYKCYKIVAKCDIAAKQFAATDYVGDAGQAMEYVKVAGVPSPAAENAIWHRGIDVLTPNARCMAYYQTPSDLVIYNLFREQLNSKPIPIELSATKSTTPVNAGSGAEVTAYHGYLANAGDLNCSNRGNKYISGVHNRFSIGKLSANFKSLFDVSVFGTGKIAAGEHANFNFKHKQWSFKGLDLIISGQEAGTAVSLKKGATTYVFQCYGEVMRAYESAGAALTTVAQFTNSLLRHDVTSVNMSCNRTYGMTIYVEKPEETAHDFWVAMGGQTFVDAADQALQEDHAKPMMALDEEKAEGV